VASPGHSQRLECPGHPRAIVPSGQPQEGQRGQENTLPTPWQEGQSALACDAALKPPGVPDSAATIRCNPPCCLKASMAVSSRTLDLETA
jgi:hypothetical protein